MSKINRVGGLALFWKQDVDLEVDFMTLNFIDAIINKGKDDA